MVGKPPHPDPLALPPVRDLLHPPPRPLPSRLRQGPIQQTLLNLGRHFSIPRHDWPLLCRRLDEILSGQLRLDPGGFRPVGGGSPTHGRALASGGQPQRDQAPLGRPLQRTCRRWRSAISVELTRHAQRRGGARHGPVGDWSSWGWWICMAELGLNWTGPSRAAAVGAIDAVLHLARPGSDT